jgi:transposase
MELHQLPLMNGLESTTVKTLMNTRIKVETKDEITRIKELQKEIEQLKKLLVKKDLDAMIQDSYLEVAAEDLGYKSVAELKKKLNIER